MSKKVRSNPTPTHIKYMHTHDAWELGSESKGQKHEEVHALFAALRDHLAGRYPDRWNLGAVTQ